MEKIGHTESLVVDGVPADVDLVPDDWTSRPASNVADIERLSCVKGPRGVVKATACTATCCAR